MINDSKLIRLHDLLKIISIAKKNSETVVTYSGSFDLLHSGHIKSIQKAKKQGDILVILLNSDFSIKSYKGPLRPIVPEAERAEVLSALWAVNHIVLFDDINPKKILGLIKPDIHCNGSDWGENCVERAVVEENGGRIHVLTWISGYSTTNLVKRIQEVEATPTVKAVFIDRDGTINDNKGGYIHKQEDFEFLPGVIEGLKRLSQTDYKIIIITNQSGIGRKTYTEEDFHRFNNWLLSHLIEQGIRVDHVYHCPHHPNDNCDCRKPGIGMLLKAVKDFGIRLDESWLIGDGDNDVQCGRNANVKTIKLGEKVDQKLKLEPHYYANNFMDAVSIVLRQYAK